MQTVIRLFLFLGIVASLVAAAPSRASSNIEKRSFKVERVHNPQYRGRNGARELLKAYRKYPFMPAPQGLLEALSAQAETTDRVAAAVQEKHKGGKTRGKKNGSGNGTGAVAAGAAAGAAAGFGAGASVTGKKGGGGGKGTKSPGQTSPSVNGTTGVSNGTGIVTATPEKGDVEYLSPVTIGGQTVNMDFDSGSSDLWVFNTQLPAEARAGRKVFDPTKSSTFKMMTGASFKISYGDQSGALGNVGTDVVDIGGAVVQKQAVELATNVTDSFIQDVQSQGLVGLAFSKINTVKPQQQKTFFDNVMPSLAEPVFTADLRKAAPGAYEFGRIDSSKFTGDMNWVPINSSQGFWQFSSTKFAVGNGAAQKASSTGQAIADTGTTLILANRAIVEGYFSQVDGAALDQQAGGITVPCAATLPDLKLDIGGTMATVKGSDINFAPLQRGSSSCFAGLQEIAGPLMIFGDIFFKSQFVAFNGGNNSLGFAPHA